jgi:hypothetical protein
VAPPESNESIRIGQQMPEDTWTTRDGRKLKITEMTDDHVRHTIAMLERKLVELRTQPPATTAEIESLTAAKVLVTKYWIKLLRKEQRRRYDSFPSTEAAAAKAEFLKIVRDRKGRERKKASEQEVLKPASRFANLDLDDPEDES